MLDRMRRLAHRLQATRRRIAELAAQRAAERAATRYDPLVSQDQPVPAESQPGHAATTLSAVPGDLQSGPSPITSATSTPAAATPGAAAPPLPHPAPPVAASSPAAPAPSSAVPTQSSPVGASIADPPHAVPRAIRDAADWSWRLLVIAAAVALLGWLAWEFRVVVFPLVAALLIAAGLNPAVRRLRSFGWNRSLSAVAVFVGFVVVVAGALTLVGNSVGGQFQDVVDQAEGGLEEIRNWLAGPPFRIDETQLNAYIDRAFAMVEDNEQAVREGAATAATFAFDIVLGVVITLFALIFFLYDGDRIWAWVVRLLPAHARRRTTSAGLVAWATLAQYIRGTVLIALFDAVGITILLLILQVPLAVPLGVLVFFGAFVPLVGAFVTGALAVLVALVTHGVLTAIIVLLGIVAVQQLEANVFQPFILGRLVRIHPLAVVVTVAIGSLAGGIIGAVIAVPIVAVVNTVGKHLAAASATTPPASRDS